MSSRAPFVLLAVVVLAATAWFVLQDQGPREAEFAHDHLGSGAGFTVGASENHEALPELVEAEQSSEAGGVAQREAAEEADLSGHRVQVLAPDGSPAANVAVAHWVIPEERLEELRQVYAQPEQRVGSISRDDQLPRTNEQGFLTLPTTQACTVWVTEWERAGMTFIDAASEGESVTHTLPLHAFPMIEVRILEADGTVPNINPRLDVRIADVDSAATLPGDASGWEYGQVWWYTTRPVFYLPGGRRAFIPEPTAQDRARLEDPPGPFLFKMTFDHRGVEQVVEFDQTRREAIEFVLPAHGELALRLVGAPQGLMPTLRQVDSEGKASGRPFAASQERDVVVFEQVPVDSSLVVGAVLRPVAGQGGQGTSDVLGMVSGPTLAGERVEHTLHYQQPPGIVGQFTAPDGFDFASNCLELSNGQTWMYLSESDHRVDRPRCRVYPDGRFWIESARLEPQGMRVEDVTGVEFTALLPASEEAGRTQELRVRASFDVQLESYESVTDVGEVALETVAPYLEVRVVSADGSPVEHAEVKLEAALDRDIGSNGTAFYQSHGAGTQRTDANGEVTFYGADWSEVFGLGKRLEAVDSSTEIRRVRMQLSHEHAVSTQVDIPLHEREVEAVLAEASALAGSLRYTPGVEIVYAVVVEPGEPMETFRRTGIELCQIDFRRKPTPALQEFEIKGVPPGEWDVVFRLSSGKRDEVHRIPRVRAMPGELTRDPRMQEVSLVSAIGLIRIVVRDSTGSALTRADRERFDPSIVVKFPRGASGGAVDWFEDEIVVPVVPGKMLDLTLRADGWFEVPLGELAAGRHEVVMRESPEITLRLNGMDRIPSDAQFVLSLSAEGQHFGRIRLKSEDGPVYRVRLPATGLIEMSWSTRLANGWANVASSSIELSPADLHEGLEIKVDLPDRLVEALQE